MDKMRALKYFVEVCRSSNFSKAAKVLGVPTSSVSRRIHDLEQDIGVSLFHRSTRIVQLSELGMLYLDKVKPALEQLELAEELVGQQSQVAAGILKISCIPDYGRFRVLPALTKMKQHYPDIICDVELSDRVSNLAQNEADISIRATSKLPDRVVAKKLHQGQFILVAAPAYLAQHGTPRVAADLQDHKALLYRRPEGILYWQAKMADGWRELRPPPTLICNQGDTLLSEALAGQGLALIPEWGIAEQLASGSLCHIVLADAELSATRSDNSGIFMLYQRPKYAVKKIRVVVDFLLAELMDTPATLDE